jgi:hypothetical protein
MQNVVDRARSPLNDDAKVRHPDAKLLEYLIGGLELLRNKRPDLYFQAMATDLSALALGSTFPLTEEYAPACQEYVTARAELRGSEADLEARAAMFFSLFSTEAD